MNKDYWDYKNVLEVLDLYEFELLINDDLTLSVYDIQGGNLGNIEAERFDNFNELMERLDIYHQDYIIKDLEERYDEIEYDNWLDFYNKLIQEEDYKKGIGFNWDIDILGLITKGE